MVDEVQSGIVLRRSARDRSALDSMNKCPRCIPNVQMCIEWIWSKCFSETMRKVWRCPSAVGATYSIWFGARPASALIPAYRRHPSVVQLHLKHLVRGSHGQGHSHRRIHSSRCSRPAHAATACSGDSVGRRHAQFHYTFSFPINHGVLSPRVCCERMHRSSCRGSGRDV